ncbi:MAG: Sir2 family NAD-dependent protein deacetylase [Microbacteriaceae bacterium]
MPLSVDVETDAALPPAGEALLDRAVALLAGRRLAILTGAGVSTDSGIPDYRGEGAPVRRPMTVQQFLGSAERRQRYWAGSHLGWRAFAAAEPNAGHRAIAALEAAGVANGVVTQNVDGLHVRAGSERVVELHGSLDRVRCLDCGQTFARGDVAERISELNPWIDVPERVRLNPDGDVEIAGHEGFAIPECTVCGGILKPEVVFFGELVPVEQFAEAQALVRQAEALVVVGSSLAVNSGIRLIELAARARKPIVIVNRGVTKGDRRAAVKIDAGASEVLGALAGRLLPSGSP